MKLLSYHNNRKLKESFLAEIRIHMKADAFIKGTYGQEKLYLSGGKEPGIAPPWNLPFRFHGGELTIWTGYSRYGKTVHNMRGE